MALYCTNDESLLLMLQRQWPVSQAHAERDRLGKLAADRRAQAVATGGPTEAEVVCAQAGLGRRRGRDHQVQVPLIL